MKKLFIATAFAGMFTASSHAQIFNDVGDVIKSLDYTDGLTLKANPKKNKLKSFLWDKSTDGNTEHYSSVIKHKDVDMSVEVNVTYNDLQAKTPQVTEIHQVIKEKAGKDNLKIFTASLKDEKTTDASECTAIDPLAKEKKYECVSVDQIMCGNIKAALKNAKINADDLKKCSSSLGEIHNVLNDQSHMQRVQKTPSHKKTTNEVSDIESVNGNIFGTESAKSGGVALNEIFKVAHLCEKMGMDHKKYAHKGEAPKKEEQAQSQKEE